MEHVEQQHSPAIRGLTAGADFVHDLDG